LRTFYGTIEKPPRSDRKAPGRAEARPQTRRSAPRRNCGRIERFFVVARGPQVHQDSPHKTNGRDEGESLLSRTKAQASTERNGPERRFPPASGSCVLKSHPGRERVCSLSAIDRLAICFKAVRRWRSPKIPDSRRSKKTIRSLTSRRAPRCRSLPEQNSGGHGELLLPTVFGGCVGPAKAHFQVPSGLSVGGAATAPATRESSVRNNFIGTVFFFPENLPAWAQGSAPTPSNIKARTVLPAPQPARTAA
jgi:hypothetical protein